MWCIGEYGEMLVNNSNELEGEDPLTVSSYLKLLVVNVQPVLIVVL